MCNCSILVATRGTKPYGQHLESLPAFDVYWGIAVHVPTASHFLQFHGHFDTNCLCHLCTLRCLTVVHPPPVFKPETSSIPPGRAPNHSPGWMNGGLPLHAVVLQCAVPCVSGPHFLEQKEQICGLFLSKFVDTACESTILIPYKLGPPEHRILQSLLRL